MLSGPVSPPQPTLPSTQQRARDCDAVARDVKPHIYTGTCCCTVVLGREGYGEYGIRTRAHMDMLTSLLYCTRLLYWQHTLQWETAARNQATKGMMVGSLSHHSVQLSTCAADEGHRLRSFRYIMRKCNIENWCVVWTPHVLIDMQASVPSRRTMSQARRQ